MILPAFFFLGLNDKRYKAPRDAIYNHYVLGDQDQALSLIYQTGHEDQIINKLTKSGLYN